MPNISFSGRDAREGMHPEALPFVSIWLTEAFFVALKVGAWGHLKIEAKLYVHTRIYL